MSEKEFILYINDVLRRMKIKNRSEIIAAAMYYTKCGKCNLIKYNNYFARKAPKNYTGRTVVINKKTYKHYNNIMDSINDYKPVKKDADIIRKYILKYKLYNFDGR